MAKQALSQLSLAINDVGDVLESDIMGGLNSCISNAITLVGALLDAEGEEFVNERVKFGEITHHRRKDRLMEKFPTKRNDASG